MTILFPDVSVYQTGLDLAGTPVVICKATQGTTYTNPAYDAFKAEAARHNVYFTAYHFLTHGSPAAQAAHAYAVVGRVPLMLDFEPANTFPNMTDAIEFIDHYRALGGICYLLYLPRWYWNNLGSPSLKPF